jgi:hypothetical protein
MAHVTITTTTTTVMTGTVAAWANLHDPEALMKPDGLDLCRKAPASKPDRIDASWCTVPGCVLNEYHTTDDHECSFKGCSGYGHDLEHHKPPKEIAGEEEEKQEG